MVALDAASSTATTTTNMESTLYSLERKAIAPSLIWPAISFMWSVPASALLIAVAFMKAYSSASTPAAGATNNRGTKLFSMFNPPFERFLKICNQIPSPPCVKNGKETRLHDRSCLSFCYMYGDL